MKKAILLLTICLSSFSLVCGCDSKQTPATLYEIGRKYEFNHFDIQLDHEEEQERFVFHYKKYDSDDIDFIYDFSFYCQLSDNIYNDSCRDKKTFEYKYANNEIIEFNEDGYLFLKESTDLCAYYTNAPDEVKNVIKSRDSSVVCDVGGFNFIFYDYIIKK